MECPQCKNPLSVENASVCEWCGNQLPIPEESFLSKIKRLISILINKLKTNKKLLFIIFSSILIILLFLFLRNNWKHWFTENKIDSETKNKKSITSDQKQIISESLKEKFSYVIENLDKATYKPIKDSEYDFAEGGVLTKYEYIRSLLSYEDLQAMLNYPIFLSGPHTQNNLNLKSEYTFGHYNPKFVSELRFHINEILRNNYFIKYTKPIMEKFNILPLLTGYKTIYEISKSNPTEFEAIKSQYLKGLKDQSWSSQNEYVNGYRDILPDEIKTEQYWNWGETSYYFWIRRDIDNTKEIWIGIINDVLNAYDYSQSTIYKSKY
jgi:hypothetical protein